MVEETLRVERDHNSHLLDFYATPSATSSVGRHGDAVAELGSSPIELSRVVRGLLVHDFMAMVRGLELPPERMAHMRTVGAEAILDNVVRLDPSPLEVKRPADRRMVGFCYHFALLHVALLRAVGTPARLRCGFAAYFSPGHWIDHWVVEYWDGAAWHLHDAQLGRDDLAPADFHSGITAWTACRDDPSTSASYGNGELWGWDELRGSLVNDIDALNTVEVAGWYWCEWLEVEPLDQPHAELDAALDALARLTGAADSAHSLRDAYDSCPALHPPHDAEAR